MKPTPKGDAAVKAYQQEVSKKGMDATSKAQSDALDKKYPGMYKKPTVGTQPDHHVTDNNNHTKTVNLTVVADKEGYGNWANVLKAQHPEAFSGPKGGKATISNPKPDVTYNVSATPDQLKEAHLVAKSNKMESAMNKARGANPNKK